MTDIADAPANVGDLAGKGHMAAEPMGDDLVFSVASRCFWHIGEDEWADIADKDIWAQFVEALVRMGARRGAPYMRQLATPPRWEAFRVAQRRFVGGLPSSAVPVESLYATPDQMIVRDPSGKRAYWLQQPALYMRQLIERLGMEVPREFHDCPDHLALELDMASTLLASGASDQAADFIAARLGWLARYRARIAEIAGTSQPTERPGASRHADGGGLGGPSARSAGQTGAPDADSEAADAPSAPPDLLFHAALVDALIDVASSWKARPGTKRQP